MNRRSKKQDAVAHAVNHEVRSRMIEALWHSHEALTAERFHREYLEDRGVTLQMVGYHVKQLALDGIVQLDGEPANLSERPFVLAGPNSGEAIRRLQLTPTRPH
jgi:nuclear transport factor 2 (NTF2) superfamily protein